MDSDDGGTKRSGRGRGRTRGTRGRARGRGRGRGKKASRVISSDEEEDVASPEPQEKETVVLVPEKQPATAQTSASSKRRSVEPDVPKKEPAPVVSQPPVPPEPAEPDPEPMPAAIMLPAPTSVPLVIDMEADISQLEAPTFTTISRGPPEPMLHLNWNHRVNLIGEKVLNPMIYCCDECDNPILIYGRMIPCKHVFCLQCARSDTLKVCPRCKEKVARVEQTRLGTVFMCTHGGTRYGNTGCRRTYLSQRDLQAHINHRHVTNPAPSVPSIQPLIIPPAHQTVPIQPMELSPMSKLLSEKVNSGGVASLRKNSSSEPIHSPRAGVIRSSEVGDSYYNYSSSAPNQQHLHSNLSQQSPIQQHLSRPGYSPYGHQTSSPQQPQSSNTTSSISSSHWSQSTSQYYR